MPKVKEPKLDESSFMDEDVVGGDGEKPNVHFNDIITLQQGHLKIVAEVIGMPTERSPGYIGKIRKLCTSETDPGKLLEDDFVLFEKNNICLIGNGCEPIE